MNDDPLADYKWYKREHKDLLLRAIKRECLNTWCICTSGILETENENLVDQVEALEEVYQKILFG